MSWKTSTKRFLIVILKNTPSPNQTNNQLQKLQAEWESWLCQKVGAFHGGHMVEDCWGCGYLSISSFPCGSKAGAPSHPDSCGLQYQLMPHYGITSYNIKLFHLNMLKIKCFNALQVQQRCPSILVKTQTRLKSLLCQQKSSLFVGTDEMLQGKRIQRCHGHHQDDTAGL